MSRYTDKNMEDNPTGLTTAAMSRLADIAGVGVLNWHITTGEIRLDRRIAQLAGYEPGELPHSAATRRALIFEDDRELVERCVKACLEGEQDSYSVEYRMRRKDGGIVAVCENAIVYERDDAGNAVSLAAMVLDRSELKWADQKTRDIERQFKSLSEGVSQGALAEQNRLLRAANSAAAMIIGGFYQDYQTVLRQALQILGESVQADRAGIYRNTDMNDRQCFFLRSEWAREPSLSLGGGEDEVLAYEDILPDWLDAHRRQGVRGRTDALPRELSALPGMDRAKSVMLIPLFLNGSFWGMLRFDDCSQGRLFTESEAEIMESGALIIASSISRNEIFGKLDKARTEAMASTKAKSEFLSRMSHEIRTPMNAIIGMSAIASKSGDMPKVRYCLEKIGASSRQLLNIINDVLDMSKIDANKFDITEDEFNFERMLQNAFSVVQVKLEEKHQDLHLDLNAAPTRKMISDELRLSQVLINLLNNAVKFTPEGGKIIVRVREEPLDGHRSRLRVEVEDNGVGIEPESQKRLFHSFEQADGSITRQYGGTGLGLAICKKIVTLMGGDIWVESAPGQGSRFIFEIEAGWGEALDKEAGEMPAPGDMRILVVDDSPDVLEYFHNILGGFSMPCDTAASGPEAVAAVRERRQAGERPYDMIFLDWNMPGMNGGETAREIQKIVSETIVVMISVADWSDIEQEAKAAGVSNFLSKPVLPSVLYNTIVSLTQNTLVTPRAPDTGGLPDWRDKTILLVEDVEINREIVMSIIEETGVAIECACDGLQAVDIFAEKGDRYDLILMDVQMPVMDGLSATRNIRAMDSPKAKRIPIIAMTANAFKEDAAMCLDAGMNHHIAKPFEVDTVLTVLSDYLGMC